MKSQREKNKKFLPQTTWKERGQFFLFVTFFFNRKEVFLFSWKKKRKEKNKKVSILLEVVDDAYQEQIKKKKLLTSQVLGEKRVAFLQVLVFLAFLIGFLRKKTKLKSKNKFFLLLSGKKRKQKQLFLCDSRLAYVTLGLPQFQ